MVLTSVNAKMLYVNIVIVVILFAQCFFFPCRCVHSQNTQFFFIFPTAKWFLLFLFFCRTHTRKPAQIVNWNFSSKICATIQCTKHTWIRLFRLNWNPAQTHTHTKCENVRPALTIHTNHQLIENFSPVAMVTEVFTSKVSQWIGSLCFCLYGTVAIWSAMLLSRVKYVWKWETACSRIHNRNLKPQKTIIDLNANTNSDFRIQSNRNRFGGGHTLFH